ncbi:hypothetical protein PF005_g15845 [Phytophthora fragariae]|uniref:SWIM-type domain-containing protein n=1 Tax=Phytophthora fragariae TaxID=53985 RepID=A0A6A3XBW4_9STRA|nr:hypothetical protein PF003_g24409 [Phytophthora fragariae]KAE8932748.1 hypothetical protein PF009_g17232 [Phytophthora fragariae]KAE9132996.1 hypothetical protein PF006_g15151 [Phytophthora fragariae]KAE9199183.1 hypothetical protein PF005_g15845 [Phytophthora fragariae]KAE9236110.1 hypothetical protein PF002_g11332 [Phytophthora fragariae]
MTVIHDSSPQPPTPDNKIYPPTTATGKAAAAMIAKGRAAAYATQPPTLSRVKQLPKESTGEVQEMEELSAALDGTFTAAVGNSETSGDELLVGPILLVREQRTRAARLYNIVVTWSLWYARTNGMPEDGWIVDVEKCVCGCKFYNKFKTCCHIVIARKAKRLSRPGVEDKSEKLFNRQVRKIKSGSLGKRRKTEEKAVTNVAAETELPLQESSDGRPLLASRALDLQYILCSDT